MSRPSAPNFHQPNKTRRIAPRVVWFAFLAILGATGAIFIAKGLWVYTKAELAQVLLNQAFERTRNNWEQKVADPQSNSSSHIRSKPWHWADIAPLARIHVARLNQSNIVLDDASSEALAFGPGHMPDTALPGKPGTTVFAAHRDTHFAWIRHLKIGDIVEVADALNHLYRYEVRRNWISRFDQSGIDPQSMDKLLVLATCYPFEATNPGPMRFMVEAELLDTPRLASASK